MIKVGTILKVRDNSSVQKVRCIKILGGSVKKVASIGDLIVLSVKDRLWVAGEEDLKKVYFGIISSVKKNTRRLNGMYYASAFNSCVVLTKSKDPLGTTMYGAVGEELWKQKIKKLNKMAELVF